MKLSALPKLINKEKSISEIWHYFGYKTDDKGERTDLTGVAIGLNHVATGTHQIF